MKNIALAGSKNVRDLGGIAVDGGVVRDKLLLRGGDLFACTPFDAGILRNKYGVSLIVDLRTPLERNMKPDKIIPGAKTVRIPILKESTVGITRERPVGWVGDPAKVIPDLDDLYRRMVSDECRDNLARAVQTIVDAAVQERTVLFHCSEGKDRAGITAAILLSLLGATRKAIMDDYLFTNTICARKADWYYWFTLLLGNNKKAAEKLRAVFSARAHYLEAAFDAIDKDWGGMAPFVEQGLGIDSARLEAFRRAAIT